MIPKFRAWDKRYNTMSEVTSIDFSQRIVEVIRRDDKDTWNEAVLLKQIELMQSTGIKDHNGIEIYEGDILHLNPDDPWYGHVKYMDEFDCPAFNAESPSDYYYDSNVLSHEKCCGRVEVVGNIYENPVYSTEDGII